MAEEMRPQAFTNAARHPRFKFFPEAGEEIYHTLLGVPLVDRGSLQGVLVVQTAEPREFSGDEISMLVAATAQLSPLVSELRALEHFVAPAYERLRALAQQPVVVLGSRSAQPVSRARSGPLARMRPQSDRAVAQHVDRLSGAALPAVGAAQPHQLRLSPHARVPGNRQHLGRAQRRRAVGPAGGLFLGRVRPARVGADLLRRLGHSLGRSHQERLGPGHSAGRHRPVLRPGIFPPAARQPAAGSKKTISI